MPFSTPRSAAMSYLVLRHLYEGDVIEWPLASDHPQKPLFDGLESQGFVVDVQEEFSDQVDKGAVISQAPEKGADLQPGETVTDASLKYVNRLSDFLFVAGRYANDKGARDVLWAPGQNR